MTVAELDPPPYDERIDLYNKLATIADRSIKPDALKFLINENREVFANLLSSGTPKTFEIVLTGLLKCGTRLPHKAPIYATLVAILTKGDEPYAKKLSSMLVEIVLQDFTAAVKDGKTSLARRSLRFLSGLGYSRVVSASSIAAYILVLLDAALYELTNANRSEFGVHCRGEFLADIALSVLPWAGIMLEERTPQELIKIMDTVRQIEDAWKSGGWRCVSPATNQRCVESFSELLDATFLLKEGGWEIPDSIIPRPHKEFEEQIAGGHEIVLGKLAIPGHSKLTRYSAPRFRLCLVNAKPDPSKKGMGNKLGSEKMSNKAGIKVDGIGSGSGDGSQMKIEKPSKSENPSDSEGREDSTGDGENGKAVSADGILAIAKTNNVQNDVAMTDKTRDNKPHSAVAMDATMKGAVPTLNAETDRSLVEQYVLRTYISDVVDNFSTNHVMAAEKLLTIPSLHKVDDEIVEGLFSLLCAMPDPTHAPVYYGTLFVDLCRVKDSRLPIKLLTAVEAMFQDAALFDPESFDRLTEWFSFHLSNFEYKWNWSDWAVYADADMVDKFPFRALFCKDVLARCIRLSYYERILDVVPDEMKYFLPPKPNNGNRSRFDEVVNENLMRVVTGKDKQEGKVVRERLAALLAVNPRPEDPEELKKAELQTNMLRLSALIRSILQAGCKTLSHFDTVCERYLVLLHEMTKLGGVPAKKLLTLEVSCFWDDVHNRRMYILDKLCMLNIIDGMAIIDSALTEHRAAGPNIVPLANEELKKNLAESNCWEMIRLVLQRARAREESARTELKRASQAAASANEGEAEAMEKRLDAAKAHTARSVSEISELLLLSFRKLFALCNRLLGENVSEEDDIEKSEFNRNLPGFDDKPVWYWRCLGMIRELARKHPQFLGSITEKLEEETGDAREKHQELWDSFEIIKEIEGSAMLRQVW